MKELNCFLGTPVCLRVYFLTIPFLLFFAHDAMAQNLIPKFGKDHRELKINGGIRLINDFYFNDGIAPRRDGYQFRAQARLNLNILGIDAPFAFNFSDGNKNFKLPSYTFTGISPSYKIATLHVGDRSMFLSRYTLGNITFGGIGLELKPKKFYLGAMYGRLRRAVAEDLDGRQDLDPSYKRMAYAIKTGYQGNSSNLSFIFFSANDDKNSITSPTTYSITPNSNMVASIQGSQKLSKRVNLNVEWAHSLFNKDSRALSIANDSSFGNTYGGLFTPNASFQKGDAFNSKLNFTVNDYAFNLSYEKISRGFRTLGAIFFNNDLENISAGVNKSWLEGKLNLSLNGGIERTNLDEFVAEKTARVIGSTNVNYTPSEKWNYSLQYSNFQNSTKLRATSTDEIFVDSIFLAQVTQAASFTATHFLAEKGNGGSITALLSFQNANSIVEDVISENQHSNFWYGSLLYQSPQSEDFGWGSSISVNRSTFSDIASTYITPSFFVNKTLLKKKFKSDARLSLNYIEQASNTIFLINLGAGGLYQLNKDNSFRLSANALQQFGSGDKEKQFLEVFLNVTYGYKFRRNGKKKEKAIE